MKKCFSTIFCVLFSLFAEEGMWTFDQIPKEQIQRDYQIHIQDELWPIMQKSCLRISLGGSGAFVSHEGLLITNHHVGSKAISLLSSKQQNLMETGFYALQKEKERKCPQMHVDVLLSIKDVTDLVKQDLSEELSSLEYAKKVRKKLAILRDQWQKETSLFVEAVILHGGAQYHLYAYQRYTDVRLVMAPEKRVAYFGGDEKNFEYPRYNFDFCFFRVYENGKPLTTKHYLPWNFLGPKEEELLFVVGNPGRTTRLYTADHQEFHRDVYSPMILEFLADKIQCLEEYASCSQECARQAEEALFSLKNSQKVYQTEYEKLQSLPLISRKKQQENEWMRFLSKEKQQVWEDLRLGLHESRQHLAKNFFLHRGSFLLSELYEWAQTLVRYREERKKPLGEKLPGFEEIDLEETQRMLFSERPVYLDLEKVLILKGLESYQQILGKQHPIMQSLCKGKDLKSFVDEICSTTKLHLAQTRQEIYENPELGSQDPLFALAEKLDPIAREAQETFFTSLSGFYLKNYSSIGKILSEELFSCSYPDATFTLRLTYGKMLGYEENEQWVEPVTCLKQLYEQEQKKQLPERWLSLEKELDSTTSVNFITNHDIIGGNSGSPVINTSGEFVGVIFDGNNQSLTADIAFDAVQARAISVHSEGISYVLKHIYQANALLEELKKSSQSKESFSELTSTINPEAKENSKDCNSTK